MKKFIQDQGLNTESEALLIYMCEDLDLNSDTIIFEIEETKDDFIFEKERVKYIQLFPIEYAVDLIEHDLNIKDKVCSDLEIAERLLEYRKYDA